MAFAFCVFCAIGATAQAECVGLVSHSRICAQYPPHSVHYKVPRLVVKCVVDACMQVQAIERAGSEKEAKKCVDKAALNSAMTSAMVLCERKTIEISDRAVGSIHQLVRAVDRAVPKIDRAILKRGDSKGAADRSVTKELVFEKVETRQKPVEISGVAAGLVRALDMEPTVRRRRCDCNSGCHWCCSFYGGIGSAAGCFRFYGCSGRC